MVHVSLWQHSVMPRRACSDLGTGREPVEPGSVTTPLILFASFRILKSIAIWVFFTLPKSLASTQVQLHEASNYVNSHPLHQKIRGERAFASIIKNSPVAWDCFKQIVFYTEKASMWGEIPQQINAFYFLFVLRKAWTTYDPSNSLNICCDQTSVQWSPCFEPWVTTKTDLFKCLQIIYSMEIYLTRTTIPNQSVLIDWERLFSVNSSRLP